MNMVVKDVPELNVEEAEEGFGDWASYYGDFIQKVRANYFPSDVDDPKQREKRSYLDESDYNSVMGGEELDIILKTDKSSQQEVEVRLRIDLYRFSILGYEMMNHPHHDSQWLEFGYYHSWRRCPPTHKILGSSFLEFDSGDSCIFREIGEGQTLSNILFGQQQLIAAVNFLATSTSNQERAWSLIIVSVMICEAVKFRAVSNFFIATFPRSLPLPPYLARMCLGESGDVLTIAGIPKFSTRPRYSCLLSESGFCGDANIQMGFLQTKPVYYDIPMSKRELVEVFSITITKINGKNFGCQFYGTISFIENNSTTRHIYYNREREEPEFIYPGDDLLLTGPSSCICLDWSDIGFNFVISGKRIQDMYHCTQISWNILNNEYDEPLSDEFVSDDCTLMLSFIVLKDAVQATVEVTIVEINKRGNLGSASAHIFGKISAKFIPGYEIVLFQKTQMEKVKICPGKPIELLRPAIAVPWKSCLVIHVELDDDDDNGGDIVDGDIPFAGIDDGHSAFPFAKGIAKFDTERCGLFVCDIIGSCCQIQVRVTFT